MKKLLALALLCLTVGRVVAQVAPPVSWAELAPRMKPGSADSTVVVNFWATWCKPCIEEMPLILAAQSHVQGAKVRFLLVSLDFLKDREKKLLPFLAKQGWPIPVVLLKETDYNSWIPLVDAKWEGNIPATLIVNGNGKRTFIGHEVLPGELEHLLGLP
jgi:thiol-disulfide isomerase/thioredoxin